MSVALNENELVLSTPPQRPRPHTEDDSSNSCLKNHLLKCHSPFTILTCFNSFSLFVVVSSLLLIIIVVIVINMRSISVQKIV